MKKAVLWVVIIVIAVFAISYLVRSPEISTTEPGTETASSTPAVVTEEKPIVDVSVGVTASTNVKEFTVTGKNFSFAPSTLTVKKGDTVKITFVNSAGFHDFKIDEFKVATARIGSGKQETISFVADKAGSFEYYCSVGDHRAMGMKGALIVQ